MRIMARSAENEIGQIFTVDVEMKVDLSVAVRLIAWKILYITVKYMKISKPLCMVLLCN